MSEPVGTAPIATPGGGTAAPVAPAAPIEPAAPVAPTAEEQDDAEWDAVENEMFPGLKSTNKQDKKDEPAKPEKTAEEIAAEAANPNGEKPDAGQGAGNDTPEGSGPATPTAPAPNEQSVGAAARAYAQQVEQTKQDVIKQMFADIPETLQDADGDPITGIDDVMKLINPRTGEAFTDEEAGMWLLNAQQKFNQQRGDMEKEATAIAEVNIEIREQADRVNAKYGEYLKANTDLRDELWAEWQESLVKHEKSGVITKMPMSLERFYERALSPRVEAAKATEAATAQAEADRLAAEEAAKKEAEDKKKNNRSDRSDIYGGTKLDTRDDEEKEWDEAEKVVFG